MNAAALLAGKVWLIHAPALAALRLRLDALGPLRMGPEPGPKPEPLSFIHGPWPGYRIDPDGIAHIKIHDVIVNRDVPIDNIITSIFGGTILDHVRGALADARTNKQVKGVLLDIDSPGGDAFGTPETARQIRELDARKPVTAHISGLGASAAYYLASAAGQVIADPTAMIGSIGTVISVLDDREMLAREGIKVHEFVSVQSPAKRPDPESEPGRAQIQEWVDSLADLFISDVARYRDTSPLRVMEDFGQGNILIASEAVQASVGSIDGIGSPADALKALHRRIATQATPKRRPSVAARGPDASLSDVFSDLATEPASVSVASDLLADDLFS